MKLKCIKQYASEPEVYGIDFLCGVIYSGKREDKDSLYIHSDENGTDVYLSNEEVAEYFVEEVCME